MLGYNLCVCAIWKKLWPEKISHYFKGEIDSEIVAILQHVFHNSANMKERHNLIIFLGKFPLINYINPWDDRYPSEYLTSITMKNYSRGKNFSSRALSGLIEEVQRGKNRQQVKFSDSSWEAHINKMLRYISNMLQPLSFPLFQFISLSQTKNVSIQFFMLNAWFF